MRIFKLFFFFVILSLLSCSCDKPLIEKITPEKYLVLKKDIRKRTIIHFWFSYCEPCIKDFPELLKLAEKNKINLINISSDKSDSKMQENMQAVMERLNVRHSYIIDYKDLYPAGTKNIDIFGDFAKKIGMKNYGNPMYILIDGNGQTIMETYDLKELKEHLK